MEKFRDFIYNTSDILITLVIILIATGFITWRVELISGYGDDEINTDIAQESSIPKDKNKDNGIEYSTTDLQANDSKKGDFNRSATAKDGAIYNISIKKGSTESDMAKILTDNGLIISKDDFYAAVKEAGASGKLKYGNFKIPAGSTALDIVKILVS